jgi:hypothetical protein
MYILDEAAASGRGPTVAVEAVSCEQVSVAVSLLTGRNTGSNRAMDGFTPQRVAVNTALSRQVKGIWRIVPLYQNREITGAEQGVLAILQGVIHRTSGVFVALPTD